MFSRTAQPSLQERLRLPTYRSLYQNVRNRLCTCEERLNHDFFTSVHQGGQDFIDRYRDQPMAYHCITSPTFLYPGGVETTYLVVGGRDRAVLLLEPDEAQARNLPFLSVLDGALFRPCLESATSYWQTHIEPFARKSENVLSSAFRPANFLPV